MLNVFCLGAALTIGQGSPIAPPVPPSPTGESSFASERAAKIAAPQPVLPMPAPAPTMLPRPALFPNVQQTAPGARMVVTPTTNPSGLPVLMQPVQSPLPMPKANAPMATIAPMPKAEPKKMPNGEQKNGDEKKNGDEEKKNGNGDEKKEDDRGYFMKALDGTYLGSVLTEENIKVDGWIAASYNISTRNVSNLPVTWNDRADTALLQQFWVNIEKPLDWNKPEVQHGFKVALLYGSDYRFTLIRGLFNNQLKNQNTDPKELNGFEQNIYGGDIPVFTYNVWLPGIGGEGTEIQIGRMFCFWGYESVMAPATPLMSRSYAFNWAPPFFHVGAMATTKVNQNLTVKNMIINGNDVWFDGSQKWRYAGQIVLTSDDEKQSLALSTSFGEGKFDATEPHGPAQKITTIGLAYEPFGRNNMNVFDLVYTNKLTDDCTVALEAIYGYQRDVPAAATGNPLNFGGGTGTAQWGGAVGYLQYNFNEKWAGTTRLEWFRDCQGQRTGFEGNYYAGTLGLQFKPCKEVMIRPEVRYDYNNDSKPFNGHHGIFTAGADLIIRF